MFDGDEEDDNEEEEDEDDDDEEESDDEEDDSFSLCSSNSFFTIPSFTFITDKRYEHNGEFVSKRTLKIYQITTNIRNNNKYKK
jgi:hypothetical protein